MALVLTKLKILVVTQILVYHETDFLTVGHIRAGAATKYPRAVEKDPDQHMSDGTNDDPATKIDTGFV
jgi:hypothetical protein